ncbi:hypothetical protein OEB99_01385 [Actinotalea sp. M2MS4P-6]|uniref:SecDF P1 head subdomain-containing protein n=1 Tax=Actinotalea sp. M2MS4P-6 TaxID=2983762 RepID=UPI0021E37E2A|nr:hypothetical protein [Actinotalea sp. M2MS4P-6]MCV2392949.1 hypothetical protein [Actinotalea sp. M2MS4P-6]
MGNDTTRRRPGIRTAALVAAGLVAATVAVGLSPWGWWHAQALPGAIELRLVTSSTDGTCTEPPLTSGGAGRACDIDDATTYELGPTLGEATVATAHEVTPGSSQVNITLTSDGADEFARITNDLSGQQVALLVDGQVIGAPVVMAPVTLRDIELAMRSSHEAVVVVAMLHGEAS